MSLFEGLGKSILKFIWKYKISWRVKSSPEQKDQCWSYHNTCLQIILQSHSKKNSMILAQKQIQRQIEQNRRPRNKSTQL
jgi:hypothetical protein